MATRALAALGLLAPDAAAPPPPPPAPVLADGAGNRQLPFLRTSAETINHSGRYCTQDRSWCAELARNDVGSLWNLAVWHGMDAAPRKATLPRQYFYPVQFWMGSRLVREAGGAVLFLIERSTSVDIPDGGLQVNDIVLMRAEPGTGLIEPILDMALHGGTTVNVCAIRKEPRPWRGPCGHTYSLFGSLDFDAGTREGRPRFILTTNARTYPGRRPGAGAGAVPPPAGNPYVGWTDPSCTYRRILVFDPASNSFQPDTPQPDCSDYLGYDKVRTPLE